jgi:dTDP-4-amino-4,6-dideoxygalactose transaminase
LLESRNIIAKRKAIFAYYDDMLRPLAEEGHIETPQIPENCTINYYMYYILVKDNDTRSRLLESLNQAGISAVFHFVPLHDSPFARKRGIDAQLPVTEDVAGRILRLPFYNCMTQDEQQHVAEHIFRFFNEHFVHTVPISRVNAAEEADRAGSDSEFGRTPSGKGPRKSQSGTL